MAVVSSAHSTIFSKTSLFHHINGFKRFSFCLPFSSSTVASLSSKKKWRQPVASSVLELGGIKIAKDDVVRDDPTNNVPDTIFSKLGLQLHRRNNHPLGILKNGIYEYFDTNFPNMFHKFDDLCPVVSVKQIMYIYALQASFKISDFPFNLLTAHCNSWCQDMTPLCIGYNFRTPPHFP